MGNQKQKPSQLRLSQGVKLMQRRRSLVTTDTVISLTMVTDMAILDTHTMDTDMDTLTTVMPTTPVTVTPIPVTTDMVTVMDTVTHIHTTTRTGRHPTPKLTTR